MTYPGYPPNQATPPGGYDPNQQGQPGFGQQQQVPPGYGGQQAPPGYGQQVPPGYGGQPQGQPGYGQQVPPGYGGQPQGQPGYGPQPGYGQVPQQNFQAPGGWANPANPGWQAQPGWQQPQPGYGAQPGYYGGQPGYGGQMVMPDRAQLPRGDLAKFYDQPSSGEGKALNSFFRNPNQSIAGVVARTITNADVQPDTDMVTGEVRKFKDGRVRWHLVVPLLVQSFEFPEGRARLFVRGQIRDELNRAMSAAQVPPNEEGHLVPEEGAMIIITFTGYRAIQGLNPQKIFEIVYYRPEAVAQGQYQLQPQGQQAQPAAPQFGGQAVQQLPGQAQPGQPWAGQDQYGRPLAADPGQQQFAQQGQYQQAPQAQVPPDQQYAQAQQQYGQVPQPAMPAMGQPADVGQQVAYATDQAMAAAQGAPQGQQFPQEGMYAVTPQGMQPVPPEQFAQQVAYQQGLQGQGQPGQVPQGQQFPGQGQQFPGQGQQVPQGQPQYQQPQGQVPPGQYQQVPPGQGQQFGGQPQGQQGYQAQPGQYAQGQPGPGQPQVPNGGQQLTAPPGMRPDRAQLLQRLVTTGAPQ